MTKNVLLCGVGGQGTVLASRLIALAAMEKGMEARGAETIGMAQRGGSVVSHVRIGAVSYTHLQDLAAGHAHDCQNGTIKDQQHNRGGRALSALHVSVQ